MKPSAQSDELLTKALNGVCSGPLVARASALWYIGSRAGPIARAHGLADPAEKIFTW